MKVPTSAAGKSGKCKSCKNTVIVPKHRVTPDPVVVQPKRKSLRFLMATIIAAFVASAGWYANDRFIGTRNERWSNIEGNVLYQYDDSISKWTGKVVRREMNAFMNETKVLLSMRRGLMDENEKPHGQWEFVIPLTNQQQSEWYWHGEGCTEAEFVWRSTHVNE